jgi:hypothetical protein
MSVHDAVRPTIVRDPASGLPLITTVGEVQQRAMVERGQAVVQELQAKVAQQAAVIQRVRGCLALLCLEAEDELLEFDSREFTELEGRELEDEIIETPDGRSLWRIYLKGDKSDAVRQRTLRPRLVKAEA